MMEARFASDGRVEFMRDARQERWNSDEELVAVVSFVLRIDGSRVSLDCKTQPGHFLRASDLGCPNGAMEARHVCRQT